MAEKNKRVTLENVQMMWAKLDKPNERSDNPKYEVELQNLSKEHIKLLGTLDPPYEPNSGKERGKPEKGHYCTPKSSRPVPVYDSLPKKMTLEDVATIGNGSTGNVTVHSFAYTRSGNKGVACGLDSVQVVKLEVYNENPYGSVDGGYKSPELADQPTDNVPY